MAVDLSNSFSIYWDDLTESDGANMASLSPRAVSSVVSCPYRAVDCTLYVLCAERMGSVKGLIPHLTDPGTKYLQCLHAFP